MHNTEIARKREQERQYLKITMECLQFLGQQGIAIRGDEDGNGNFTQLLLLQGEDHPNLIERLTSNVPGIKRFTDHDFQDELFNV